MNKEDVVSYFLAEEFDGLFKHYAQAIDLNVVTEQNPRNEYRYSINLGEADGFTWPVMKDWLREAAGLKKYAVEGVEVFKTKSEFSIVADEEKKLVEAVEGLKWGNVKIKLLKIGTSGGRKKKDFGRDDRFKRDRKGGGGGFSGEKRRHKKRR